MSLENPFLNQNVPPVEKYKLEPEIEQKGRYFARQEKRHTLLGRILDEKFGMKEMAELFKKLIRGREKKQAVLREPHQKTKAELEAEYKEKYGRLGDENYAAAAEGKTLKERMAREAAYYELNPTEKDTETEGELQERHFIRGAVMHKRLAPLGLSGLKMTGGNLDPDCAGLEAVYERAPEKLAVFNTAAAGSAIDHLFALGNIKDEDREAILDEVKNRTGCQETIFVLEDICDSHEGLADNIKNILGDWDGADKFIPGFKKKSAGIMRADRRIFERYQRWDRCHFVNNDLGLDNLDTNSRCLDWKNAGITNNFLNALVFDYGSLRLDAWERGEDEFVRALDEGIMKRFEGLGDAEAGEALIRAARLRSFSMKASDLGEDEDGLRERVKAELSEVLG